jgi:hypothetical protein
MLTRTDGSEDEIPLIADEQVFNLGQPGTFNTPTPTSPAGRADTSVRVDLEPGEPISALEVRWDGPGQLRLRAATLGGDSQDQEQLLLQPGLYREVFHNLKVYETTTIDLGISLVPRGEIKEDAEAVAFLRSATPTERHEVAALAPGTPAHSAEPSTPPTLFVQTEGRAGFHEQLSYRRAQGDGAGYLIVDDAWFPGWRATVDGRETSVERANVHFKAVWVPAGAQTVVLTYEPESLRRGMLMSLAALLLAAGLFLRGRLA